MRAAVVFRHVHELSVAETAAALDCSEGNVKSQTARGLERLRAALAPELPPAPPAPPSGPRPARSQPLSRQSTDQQTRPTGGVTTVRSTS